MNGEEKIAPGVLTNSTVSKPWLNDRAAKTGGTENEGSIRW